MRVPQLAVLAAQVAAAALLLHGCGGGSGGGTPPPAPSPDPTCAEGSSGTDFCCPMPGSASACAEEACDLITTIVPGKLWTVVKKANGEPPEYVGPPHLRMIIMLLDAGVGGHGDKSLVLVNAIELEGTLLQQLKDLEAAQGATVRYALSTGDWHWLFLGHYLADFPEATAYVPPGRIPDEQQPSFNYTVLDMSAPLNELRPALQIHNMQGLIQPQIPPYDENSTRNELFFFHESTQTLVAGDLFWLFTCEPSGGETMQWPGASKGGLQVWNYGGSTIWGSKAEDIAAARVSAQLLLDLNFTRFIPVHGEIGNLVPPDADPSANALFEAALKDPVYGILPSERFVM